MTKNIQIKRWDNQKVIHEGPFRNVRECLEDGVRKGISFAYANLTHANLTRANLTDADLTDADLTHANLFRATFVFDGKKIKIRKAMDWVGMYEYHTMAFICTDGSVWIKMGCKFGPLSWWNENWYNNPTEFPKGELKTDLRRNAFDFAVNWARINSQMIGRHETGEMR